MILWALFAGFKYIPCHSKLLPDLTLRTRIEDEPD